MKNSILKITSAAAIVVTSVCGFSGASASDNDPEVAGVSAKYFVYDEQRRWFDDHPDSDKHFVEKVGYLAGEVGTQTTAKYNKYRTEVLPAHQSQLEALEKKFDSSKYKELKRKVQGSESPSEHDVKALGDIRGLKDAVILKRAEVAFLEDEQEKNKEVAELVNDVPILLQQCFALVVESPNTVSTSEDIAYVDGKQKYHTVLNVSGLKDEQYKDMVTLFNKFDQIFSQYFKELHEAKAELLDQGNASLSFRKTSFITGPTSKLMEQLIAGLGKILSLPLQINEHYPELSSYEVVARTFMVGDIRDHSSDVKRLTPRVELYDTFVEAVEAFQKEREAHVEKPDDAPAEALDSDTSG